MNNAQRAVHEFVKEHDLISPPAERCLDLVSEVGEVAKELLKASDYGKHPAAETTPALQEELGDSLFSLLALCDVLGVDAQSALEGVLEKYTARWEQAGRVGSGR